MSKSQFDITISNISFVIYRESDKSWRRDNLVDEKSFILAYAVKGDAGYSVSGNDFSVSEGDILFFNKGQPHSAITSSESPWIYYSVGFNAINHDGSAVSCLDIPTVIHTSNPTLYKHMYETLNYEWTAGQPGYKMLCKGIAAEILCAAIREAVPKRKQNSIIEKIKKHIIENYTSDFTIEELSKMAGMSSSHLHKVFKENTGTSIKRYHNTIRISKAKNLLKSGDHSITEVAYSVGYNDIYYFSRYFKKLTGVPPTQFR